MPKASTTPLVNATPETVTTAATQPEPATPVTTGDPGTLPAETTAEINSPSLEAELGALADEVADNAPADGTVTIDFGKSGKLTGCLIMSNTSAFPGGDQVVAVPYEGGYVQIGGVPAAAVK